MNQPINFDKILKYSLSEELKWFEDEFDELYLHKDKYSKKEINQATRILEMFKEKINIIWDKQLSILLEYTLKKIEKKYPEFFNPDLWLTDI